jgi:hypothetical protein
MLVEQISSKEGKEKLSKIILQDKISINLKILKQEQIHQQAIHKNLHKIIIQQSALIL